MVPRFILAMLAGMFLVPSIEAQRPANNRTDVLGDPLPSGAVARLGTLRFKHQPASNTGVNVLVFSPDGKKIASMSTGRSVRLWDAVSGQAIPGPWDTRPCSTIAFAPDSSLLAAAIQSPGPRGLGTGEIVIWDIAGARMVHTLAGNPELVQAMVFADQGKTLILAGNGVVRWRDIAANKEERVWRAFSEEKKSAKGDAKNARTFVDHCLLSPDGKFLTVQIGQGSPQSALFIVDGQVIRSPNGGGPRDTEAMGFDLTSGKVTWRTTNKSTDPVKEKRFAYSADGQRLAAADGSDQLSLRDTGNGKLVANALLPASKSVPLNEYQDAVLALQLARIRLRDENLYGNQVDRNGTLALSCNGTTAICAGEGRVLLWNPEDPENFRKIADADADASSAVSGATAVAFSPDGRKLAVGAGAVVRVYDVDTLKEVVPLAGLDRAVDFVAFSPDGKRVITGNARMFVDQASTLTWDATTWRPISFGKQLSAGLPEGASISPDRTRYLAVGADNRLGLYDLANGKLLAVLTVPGNQKPKVRAFFLPDGKYVVLPDANSQGTASQRIYSVSSGKLLCTLPLQGSPVEPLRPMAFSADGRLVAMFAREDGLIHVYDLASGKLSQRLGSVPEGRGRIFPSNLAFSADGKLLASWHAGDNVVRVWDVASGKQRFFLPPDGDNHNRLLLAWSPDGRTLAVGDRKIQIWELATFKVRRDIGGHEGDIRSLAFSPDGRLLATGSADTTVLVWDAWAR